LEKMSAEPEISGETEGLDGGGEALFDDSVLWSLDLSRCKLAARGQGYPCLSDSLRVRPLERGDFAKGYLSLLSQLTRVGDYPREKFEAHFDRMRALPGVYYTVVVEDVDLGRVVGTATLIMELKFIRGATTRGRLEELVVDSEYRNLHLGSYLLELVTELCRGLGAYKMTLDCKPEVEGFYSKYGYTNEGQRYLTQRFHD
jgi:glucosamine-phosphate N-acetyltransferase